MSNIIYLSHNYQATCSNEDYIYFSFYDWYAEEKKNDLVYAARYKNNKTIFMHAEVIQRMGLIVPKKHTIDHRNRNGLNNDRTNLRIVTCSVNRHNSKLANNNTSGIKGVFYDESRRKWRATIEIKDRCIRLYYGDSLQEAIAARLRAEQQIIP